MKRIWHHPKPRTNGKRFWRSLGELEDTPEFREWLEREFPAGASELEADDVSRRNFMKLMGASTALAGFGMAGCRRPEAYLVPFTKNVEWVIPGKALLYATAMPRLDGCSPVIATTHEGRPTTVKGNPLHPVNQVDVDGQKKGSSGTDAFVQASVLNLYDPDRSRHYLQSGKKSSAAEFAAAFDALKAQMGTGKGIAFLVGESTSPTRDRLVGDLQTKHPDAKFYRYEAFNLDAVREGNQRFFGRDDVRQVPRLDKATRILSLDSDFLGLDRTGRNAAFGFAMNRRAERLAASNDGNHDWQARGTDAMNRLYVVEPCFTVTGGMSDHRLRVASSQVYTVALAIAKELGIAGLPDATISEKISSWVKPAVADLKAAQGKSLVLAGQQQSADVQALVAAINAQLGAFGATIDLLEAPTRPYGTLAELREALAEGQITTIISTTSADPAYDAPNDLHWDTEVLGKVTYIQVGFSVNLTAQLATWHVPGTHYLEEWGDVRSAEGTYSIMQPMIEPLFGGLSEIDLFLKLLSPEPLAKAIDAIPAEDDGMPAAERAAAPSATYVAVRETFENTLGVAFPNGVEEAWMQALRDGFLANSGYPTVSATGQALQLAAPDRAPSATELEVRFVPDSKVYDGRYVNNGWLQETPDPITKLTWDNAAIMSVATFAELGLKKDGQRVKLSFNGREGFFPVLRIPGHADHTVTIATGYGQHVCGRVGLGTGFDVFRMRTSDSLAYAQGVSLEVLTSDVELAASLPSANHAPGPNGKVKIAKWEEPALTQEHNSMEGREIVRDGTVSEFAADPTFAKKRGMDSHIPPNISLYKPENIHGVQFNDYDKHHQWAMTIDLNTCLGCTACQTACQAENNIPIVGKGQVLRGREMAWIRMDRYFADPTLIAFHEAEIAGEHHEEHPAKASGVEVLNEDAIEVLPQPVACQQCEKAPCETVCPVNATVHTEDGLNAMAYNRCIGTRYCANNCPYKARRFNFFDYNKRNPVLKKNLGPLEFGNLYAGPLGERQDKELPLLQKNPNVTVRMRGVMEKCTYCVQRIQTAKIAQKVAARNSDRVQVAANAVKTACQEACPTEAIQFGNKRNGDDLVNAYKASPRNYDLLAYVNTIPRTSYLARVKNPNMNMPGAAEVGINTKNIH